MTGSHLPARKARVSRWSCEDDVARCWWNLLPGSLLPLSDGRRWRLLFAGRSGSATGPDVRDAVLCSVAARSSATGAPVERYVGDIEFHNRATDWFVHEHHTDPRYNAVILHVVSICDDMQPTRRQDGACVPICSIQDLPLRLLLPVSAREGRAWPCHCVMQHLSSDEQEKLLTQAGLLRFEQKTHVFLEQLHAARTIDLPELYDRCLLPALAEGLGYGRDRAFFRAVGLRLAGLAHILPQPAGHTAGPAPLDAARLKVLNRLFAQWWPGIWERFSLLLLSPRDDELTAMLHSLRATLRDLGLSLARADILICNVLSPFAAAVALLEGNTCLEERARALYLHHPGLSSNRITRMMSAQLLLAKEPRGSCQQQGLHYIYQQNCREKMCESCLVGKRDI